MFLNWQQNISFVFTCHLDTYLVRQNRHKRRDRQIADWEIVIYNFVRILRVKWSALERHANIAIVDPETWSIPSRQQMVRIRLNLLNAMAQIMANKLGEYVLSIVSIIDKIFQKQNV